jgi:hypothetical protein
LDCSRGFSRLCHSGLGAAVACHEEQPQEVSAASAAVSAQRAEHGSCEMCGPYDAVFAGPFSALQPPHSC